MLLWPPRRAVLERLFRRGADLSGALFLTRRQVAGARGDAATSLPAGLEHPPHWGAA